MPFLRFFNFWNLKKYMNFEWKNLCDKVLKIKILNWQFCCIFHGLCCGISHFFCKCHIFREICNINLPLFSIFIKNRKKSILNVQFLNTQLYWSYHRDGHIQTASLVWWYRQCTSNTTIKERMLKPTLFPKVYKGVARMFFCLLYGVINHC